MTEQPRRRDDFTRKTKDLLARRVAFHCSNPACGRSTIGPDSAGATLNIGEAAHITAASENGPRWNPNLASEQRRHPDNGIHLCAVHAHVVDHDPAYSVETLLDWKGQAEGAAAAALGTVEPPQFSDDIGRLRDHTERTIVIEKAHRRLDPQDASFRIERTVLVPLAGVLDRQSVLIVGPAGAGKSAVLLETADHLRASGADVLFLDAGDPQMVDPRSRLALDHALEDVLRVWPGQDTVGYLFIDGLDATRSGAAYDVMVHLMRAMRELAPQWRLCVASRDFDLRYAPALEELFPARAALPIDAALRSGQFPRVAHVTVGPLDADEIADVAEESELLGQLFERASPAMRDLLVNPFNLRIAAEVVEHGNIEEIARVSGRNDLLDLWWRKKLSARCRFTEGEALLRTSVDLMTERRSMQLPVAALSGGDVLEALLSEGVLLQEGPHHQFVRIFHAAVFDYAVYRLLLQTQPLHVFLQSDPDRCLFVLESLHLQLESLWTMGADLFIKQLLNLFELPARRLFLITAVRVLAERASIVSEIVPILQAPNSEAPVRYIVRTLIYLHQREAALVGDRPWSAIASEMAARLPRFEHDTLLLLIELLKPRDCDEVSQQDMELIAGAAHDCISFRLRADPYDARLMGMAIEVFARTYDYDPQSSLPLLEQLLQSERLERLGQYELMAWSGCVEHIHDGRALVELYRAFFSPIDLPDVQVSLGGSQIMGMTQNARQMPETARHALAAQFPAFLAEDPDAAIEALAAVLEGRMRVESRGHSFSVTIGAQHFELYDDYTSIWERPLGANDPWQTMVAAVESWIQDGFAQCDSSRFSIAFERSTTFARAMMLWRLLVRNASASAVSAAMVAPLLEHRNALISYDLREAIVQYLTRGYGQLDQETRARLDSALLSIVDQEANEQLRGPRQCLLAEYAKLLPPEAITNDRLRTISWEASENDDQESDDQRDISTETLAQAYAYRPSNRLESHSNDAALIDNLYALTAPGVTMPTRERLLRTLQATAPLLDRVTTDVKAAASDTMASAIMRGLQAQLFDPGDYNQLQEWLLAAVRFEAAETLEGDSDWVSWGTPWRFGEGAIALELLYRLHPTQAIIEALRSLTGHPASASRAVALQGLVRTLGDPEVAMSIAIQSAVDPSASVVHAALDLARRFADVDARRYSSVVLRAYDTLRSRQSTSDALNTAVRFLLDLALQGEASATATINAIFSEPWEHLESIDRWAIFVIAKLASNDSAAASQARELLLRAAESARSGLGSLMERRGGSLDSYPPEDRRRAEAWLKVVAAIAQRLYFQYSFGARSRSVTDLVELTPIFEALGAVPLVGSAYYLVKTLHSFAAIDPPNVLRLAHVAFRSGGLGLASDPMAEGDMREFVLLYAGEYRTLLSDDPQTLEAILDIVDLFVDAGWPAWIDVILELDRVYRDES